VRLVGYGDRMGTRFQNRVVSRARAVAVERYLKQRLASLKVAGVTITAVGEGNLRPVVSNVKSSTSKSRRLS
jgi:outer membrane protein OmpA-like peptidoglycan-associated protein